MANVDDRLLVSTTCHSVVSTDKRSRSGIANATTCHTGQKHRTQKAPNPSCLKVQPTNKTSRARTLFEFAVGAWLHLWSPLLKSLCELPGIREGNKVILRRLRQGRGPMEIRQRRVEEPKSGSPRFPTPSDRDS